MELESKKHQVPNIMFPGVLCVFGWGFFVLFWFFVTDSSLKMLRGQCGTVDRTKGLWAEAAKSSDLESEVESLHLETVREV